MTTHTFHIVAPAEAQLTITINLGTGADDATHVDNLVSDADEFTSVPSAAPVNGAGNGHTTLVE
jgi:hypothetical protein